MPRSPGRDVAGEIGRFLGSAGKAARFAGKAVPYLGAALTAYEVWEAINSEKAFPYVDWPGHARYWNHCPDPNPGPPWVYTGIVSASGTYGPFNVPSCIGNQAGYGGPGDMSDEISYFFSNSIFSRGRMFLRSYWNPTTDARRGWYWISFSAPAAGYGGTITIFPNAHAYPSPSNAGAPWIIGAFPFLGPVGAPGVVAPPPLTFPRPNPWSPEAPDVGPRPAPRPRPNPNPNPNPWPNPLPNPNPWPNPLPTPVPGPVPTPVPPNVVVVNPGPNPVPRPTPRPTPRPNPNPVPRPPGPGVKETKIRMPPWAQWAWWAVSQVTEANDLIDSLYEALPKKIKVDAYNALGRQPNPIEKAQLIYNNINELNVGEAITNVIANQIEDTIFGTIGGALGDANRNSGRPIGYGAGPAL